RGPRTPGNALSALNWNVFDVEGEIPRREELDPCERERLASNSVEGGETLATPSESSCRPAAGPDAAHGVGERGGCDGNRLRAHERLPRPHGSLQIGRASCRERG